MEKITKKKNLKYNTIDIDINPRFPFMDKHYVERIIQLISFCEDSLLIDVKDSQSKGYHIFLICKKECDLCRLVFDDSKRYMLDVTERANTCMQNIMFDSKGVKDK